MLTFACKNDSGLASPFAVAFCDLQQCRTQIAPNTLNPVWGDRCGMRFVVTDLKEILYVNLWSGAAESAQFLGMCLVPLSVLPPDGLVDRWFALVPRDSSEKVKRDRREIGV
jgi:hypothetical protein